MDKIIKVILAILLLFCLAKLPYEYYLFVRYAGMIGFALLASFANTKEHKNAMYIYLGLAVLFQPFMKILLGRDLWILVDIIVAIGLVISLGVQPKEKSNS